MKRGVGVWHRVADYSLGRFDILPERNLKDLVDVPKQVQKDLRLIPVNHMDQVLEIALSKEVVSEPPRPRKPAREEEQN